MKWLVPIFILVPSIEIALLLYSGKTLGLPATITLIFITGIGGAYLAKRQGLKTWRELQSRLATMDAPGNALIDSFCVFLGGILLIMPGFLTDILGLLLLFKGPRNIIRPFLVRWLYNKFGKRTIVIR